MHRSTPILLLVFGLVSIAPRAVNAQWIELNPTPQPPALDMPTTTSTTKAILAQEIDRLQLAKSAATGDQSIIVEAFIALRTASLALLEQAASVETDAGLAWVAGMRLAEGRRTVDRALQSLLERPADDPLRRSALDGLASPPPPSRHPDSALDDASTALSTIIDAAVLAEGQSLAPGWPVVGPDGGPIASDGGGAGALTDVKASLSSAADADPLAAAMREFADDIDPATLAVKPTIESRVGAAAAVLALAEQVRTMDWLDRRFAEAVHNQCTSIAAALPATTARTARNHSADASSLTALLRALDAVQRDPRRQGPLTPVLEALPALAVLGGGDLAQRLAVRRSVGRILERMTAFRELDVRVSSRDLVMARVELQQAYRRAEAKALDSVPLLLESKGASIDPAVSSVMESQGRLLADLERVGRLSEWSDAIGALSPGAVPSFQEQMRRLCVCLDDHARRPDAVAAMAAFEMQLGLFVPIPGESAVRAGTLASAGDAERQRALVAELDRRRAAWAEAWASGAGSAAAANSLLLLRRLLVVLDDMEACADPLGSGNPARRLSTWNAWLMAPEALAQRTNEWSVLAPEAVVAAAARDDQRLLGTVEDLEHGLAVPRLAHRLSQRLAGS
ncbi:MAG: hypothetical protein KDA22_05985, partial [Phycisphaerales bacterium]|nr:hypothetical protein [Phycisphaerales bacterium]